MLNTHNMKTFKTFIREFDDIGPGTGVFMHNKAKDDALRFVKKKIRTNSVRRYKNQSNFVTPQDLKKHVIKKLSSNKKHKDYTVHHVTNKEYDTVGGTAHTAALLHHKKDGFVGTLYGHKDRQGFHIHESHINTRHRGKGLGVALYGSAVEHHGAVISDYLLSHGSQGVYKHFAKQGKVSAYNPGELEYDTKVHGKKIVVTKKGNMRVGRNTDPSDDFDIKLKIHKNKLK